MRGLWLGLVLAGCATPTIVDEFGACPDVDSISDVEVAGVREVVLPVTWINGVGVQLLDSEDDFNGWVNAHVDGFEGGSVDVAWETERLAIAWLSGGGCSGPTVEWGVFEEGGGAHLEVGMTNTDATCRMQCDMAWSTALGLAIPRSAGDVSTCMRHRQSCD